MARPTYVLSRSCARQDEIYTGLHELAVRLRALARQANGGRDGAVIGQKWAVVSRRGERSGPCLHMRATLTSGHVQSLGYVFHPGWAEAFEAGLYAALEPAAPLQAAA